MRKLIVMVVALLFGLSAGVGSSNLWLHVSTTPYCKVATNAESYHGKFIRVRARVFFAGGEMAVVEDCNPIEALAALVEFDESSQPGRYLRALTVVKPELTVADAIIEGEFNAHYSRGCYRPKFSIAARSVELISEVRDYVLPDADGEVRRVKH